MPKIILGSGDITRFKGDAAIIPCDVDLNYKRSNRILQYLAYGSDTLLRYKRLSKEESEKRKECEKHLLKELSAIGRVTLGHAVITQSYGLGVKHFIFFPFEDYENPDEILNSNILHQATRAAFSLAVLYKLETLAIPLIKKRFRKRDMLNDFILSLFTKKSPQVLSDEDIMNIFIVVSKEYENTCLKEITLYR